MKPLIALDGNHRQAIQRRMWLITLGLTGAAAGLIVATFLLVREVGQVQEATRLQMRLGDSLRDLDAVLALSTDAEAAQRGYLMTGQERYRARYRAAAEHLPRTLSDLESETLTAPWLSQQVRDIRQNSEQKFAALARTLLLHPDRQPAAGWAGPESDAGSEYTERLQSDIGAVASSIRDQAVMANGRVIVGTLSTERWAILATAALVLVGVLVTVQMTTLMNSQGRYARTLRDLTEIIEYTTDYVAQTDAKGRLQYINPSALNALGHAGDALRGRPYTEFYTPETNARWLSEILPTLKHRNTWIGETQVLLHGTAVSISHMVIAHRNPSGRVERYSSVMRNITGEVAAQKAFNRQAATLDAVVTAIPVGVAVWDVTLRYQLVNKTLQQWLGQDRAHFIGRTIAEVLGEDEYEKRRPWLSRALAGEAVQYEMDLPNHLGPRRVSITYTPLRTKDGEVEGLIGMVQDVTRQREENLRLLALSERDPLTGLLNRAGLEGYVEQHIQQGQAAGLAAICIDLDYFKPINDRYGHAAGDTVLRTFGARLTSLVRPSDAVARLGGDEFAIILTGIRDREDAAKVADKVVSVSQEPYWVSGKRLEISASVGVAFDAAAAGGWQALLSRADALSYAAKRQGRAKAVIDAHTSLPILMKTAG